MLNSCTTSAASVKNYDLPGFLSFPDQFPLLRTFSCHSFLLINWSFLAFHFRDQISFSFALTKESAGWHQSVEFADKKLSLAFQLASYSTLCSFFVFPEQLSRWNTFIRPLISARIAFLLVKYCRKNRWSIHPFGPVDSRHHQCCPEPLELDATRWRLWKSSWADTSELMDFH